MRDFEPGEPKMIDRRGRLKVSTERRIDTSAADVWSVISDHTTWTSWHQDYDEHEPLTTVTVGNGAQFRTKEWILVSETEIVRWEPDRAIGMTILRSAGLRWMLRIYYSEIVIEPLGPNSCTVRYSSAFIGTWLFWLLSAYTVGHTLGAIYLDSRATLEKLESYTKALNGPTSH